MAQGTVLWGRKEMDHRVHPLPKVPGPLWKAGRRQGVAQGERAGHRSEGGPGGRGRSCACCSCPSGTHFSGAAGTECRERLGKSVITGSRGRLGWARVGSGGLSASSSCPLSFLLSQSTVGRFGAGVGGGANKNLPHLPGLQTKSHQGAGNQGGLCPGSSSWAVGALPQPELGGLAGAPLPWPNGLPSKAAVLEGAGCALSGSLLLLFIFSASFLLCVCVLDGFYGYVFKFSNLFSCSI